MLDTTLSTEFLASAINALDDPVFVKDQDHRWIILNDAACELMGRTREELLGKSDYDIFSREQADSFWKTDNIVFETGQTNISEEIISCRNKKHIISTKKTLFFDSETRKKYIAGVIRDITERKDAESECHRHEEFLASILESLTHPLLVINANDYTVEMANSTAWKGQLNPDTKCYTISHKRDTRCEDTGHRCPLELVRNTGLPASVEHIHYDSDGNARNIEVNGYPLFDEEGNLTRMIECCLDVTERRCAEKALEENERRFRATFEQAAVGVAHVAPDGKFVRINQKFCDIVGYSHAQLINMAFQDITYPDDLDADMSYVGRMLSGEISTYSMEKRYVRKDMSVVWVNLTVSLLRDDTGEPEFFISVIEDITARKQADQQLLHYQDKLRNLTSELSLAEERTRRNAAANLHDNVLQILVISWMKLQNLQRSENKRHEKVLSEVCQTLEKAIQEVRYLTFDLSPPALYKLGLGAAVSEFLDEELRTKHGIECEIGDDETHRQLTDDLRVLTFQSIRELLINVIKHANARTVKVTMCREDDMVKVAVADDGSGFDVDKIWSSLSRTGGFGLFNIRERLDYAGGNLETESHPGGGSRFTLRVPLQTETNFSKERRNGD